MRKLMFLISIFVLVTTPCFATANYLNYILFGAESGLRESSVGTATGMVLNAATEKLAAKFYASSTSAITDIDIRLDETGDTTGINFKLSIQGDNNDAPDGTPLGATTPAFAGPAADGWIGLKTLSSNTGALTLNRPYWVVLEVSSGTPDGSNYLSLYEVGATYVFSGEKIRHYDGTNWTNTAARNEPSNIIMKHADGSYKGWTQDSADAACGNTNIYDTNRQGIKVTFGSQTTILGFLANMDKVGSPGNVTVKLYEGSTQRAVSNAVASTEIGDRGDFIYWFTTPYETSGDSVIYITVEQDGASGDNDWDFMGETYSQSTYKESLMPANFDLIIGSGADPTSYTVDNACTPRVALIITDPSTEFDEAAAGGTAVGSISVSTNF